MRVFPRDPLMRSIIWVRLRWLIPVSIVTYLLLVLAVYYYLGSASFIVSPITAYPPDYTDYHDMGNSILVLFQPNGYVRFEYVFDKPLYKGWLIYPSIGQVTQHWGAGKVNISVYAVDVAPNLITSYVFWPGYEGHTILPSNGLIISDYGARVIKITYLNVGGVPIELVIKDVKLKVYPDVAYVFYSAYRWFEGVTGIKLLNPELGLLIGIFLCFLPIPLLIILARYLAVIRVV